MLAATASATLAAASGGKVSYTHEEAAELAALLGAAAAGAALLQQPPQQAAGPSAPWNGSSAFSQFPPGMGLLQHQGGTSAAEMWRNGALMPFLGHAFAPGGGAGGGTPGGKPPGSAPSRSGKRKSAGAATGAGTAGRGRGDKGVAAGGEPGAKKPRKASGAAAAPPAAGAAKPAKRRSGSRHPAGGAGGDARHRQHAVPPSFHGGADGGVALPHVPRPTAPRGAPPPLKSLLDDVEAFEESVPDVSKPTCSRSRSWNPNEDEMVRALVREHGLRKWAFIAACLKTKTQKQVYARWRDYLQPSLTTKPWTKEEQKRLLELQAQIGNQWAQLAQLMPGRSPNAIKNRFHATKRKLERHTKKSHAPGAPAGKGGKGAAAAAAVDDDADADEEEVEEEE